MSRVANAAAITVRGAVLVDLFGDRGRRLQADEAEQQQESQYAANTRSDAGSAKRQAILV